MEIQMEKLAKRENSQFVFDIIFALVDLVYSFLLFVLKKIFLLMRSSSQNTIQRFTGHGRVE